MKVLIYALVDPRDGSYRYVGRTMNLRVRLAAHVPHRGENIRKRAWLADLWATGQRARAVVLEECGGPVSAAAAEDRWTQRLRGEGQPLTNGTGSRSHCGATGVRRHDDPLMPGRYFSIRNLERGATDRLTSSK